MPPDNLLRPPCFLKWVGCRYDHTTEIGKIQGSQEKKRMLFLSTSSSKQSPTVCSWALPWEGEKATEGRIWCLCVFRWWDIVIYNKKCIFICIPDTVQFSCSVVSDSATPWIAACQASLSITISRSSLRLMFIVSVMPSSHLILGRPLLLLPPIPPNIKVFSNESTLHMRWPKYWSFSFSIIPSKEIPGVISFRMDWLDLLAV